jgi:rRNA-processing protein FCF1
MRNDPLLLKSIVVEHKKSTFFVEMLEHKSGQKYVALEQIVLIDNENHRSEKIRINPVVLDQIIEALTELRDELSSPNKKERVFSVKIQREIVRRYLKGVEISDLLLQFGGSESAIIKVLKKHKIEIISPKVPR